MPSPPSPDVTEPCAPHGGEAGVDEILLHRVHLPLLEPFVTAHGTEVDRQVVLVEAVAADGARGWGECSALRRPTYTSEHTDGAWVCLRDRLGPAVLAGRPAGPGDAPMAWTGLATALTDLRLRRLGRSLATAIGGRRTEVAVTAVVGRRSGVDDLLAVVGARVAEGYRSVKIKIAPGVDVEPLRAVRLGFPAIAVAADANGSYRLDDGGHRAALRRLDGLGLAYVEQPLAAPAAGEAGADPAVDDLARLAADWSTPVALDESVGGPDDAARMAATGAPFVLNLKPSRVGGLDRALRCLEVAVDAGWPCFVGGMLETGVGRALALAAASWDACTMPTDLGPSSRYFIEDVTEPIELLPGALLPVPHGPGLGVTPIPARLEAVSVDRAVVRR
jgi:O-succinylbenzoate synthase